ncbi:hypothetical protein BGZ60DRAFT_421096 [Tricladium varicosporioides]|nr:hypothetical protein BGZ60DRAFT_421096 [Hymenoscyphus varicosporioides]
MVLSPTSTHFLILLHTVGVLGPILRALATIFYCNAIIIALKRENRSNRIQQRLRSTSLVTRRFDSSTVSYMGLG